MPNTYGREIKSFVTRSSRCRRAAAVGTPKPKNILRRKPTRLEKSYCENLIFFQYQNHLRLLSCYFIAVTLVHHGFLKVLITNLKKNNTKT